MLPASCTVAWKPAQEGGRWEEGVGCVGAGGRRRGPFVALLSPTGLPGAQPNERIGFTGGLQALRPKRQSNRELQHLKKSSK